MLSNDALAQLRQLKQNIHDDKDRAEGIVKGSQGRFGFIVLDDGREIYLPPEQMLRVFPDDRVAIEVVAGAEGKPLAQLERLISSSLHAFTGQYVVRENAHFVEIDSPRLSRWIFVPPKLRRSAKYGDYVRARITQHPFKDGKPQACIDTIIGNAEQKGIGARYALARFDLPEAALALIEDDLAQPDFNTRRDLTTLPLITIDGADTRDMDDALHAERAAINPDDSSNANPSGWKLTVAIADPSAWIKAGSNLEQNIAARGTSIYLPGLTVPMLPEQLANDKCSLQPDVERLALIIELWVSDSGAIARYEFSEARVRSHAKLSYDAATQLLGADATAESTPWAASLRELHALSARLLEQRRRDHIVLPERSEYRAQLDDNGKVAAYQRQQKTAAHILVEECMVAANRCAADFLRDQCAIFVSHRGFRSERRDNVKKLLAAELPTFTDKNTAELADYIALMQTLATTTHELPLREILFRSLERGYFSAQMEPHFGMGLSSYTTITSPIRKYNDYLLHRLIKAKLRGDAVPASAVETIPSLTAQLQDCGDRARQASNLAQQWLDCDYLSQEFTRNPERSWRGELIHITSSGVVVRLLDNGIQGFVDTRRSGEKFSFDSVYMRLSSPQHSYQLQQQIEVKVAAIDTKKRTISFQFASSANASEEAGLTPVSTIES